MMSSVCLGCGQQLDGLDAREGEKRSQFIEKERREEMSVCLVVSSKCHEMRRGLNTQKWDASQHATAKSIGVALNVDRVQVSPPNAVAIVQELHH